jgi:hypothetical protein
VPRTVQDTHQCIVFTSVAEQNENDMAPVPGRIRLSAPDPTSVLLHELCKRQKIKHVRLRLRKKKMTRHFGFGSHRLA